jgi:rRNA maturation endonuclease Nob1
LDELDRTEEVHECRCSNCNELFEIREGEDPKECPICGTEFDY